MRTRKEIEKDITNLKILHPGRIVHRQTEILLDIRELLQELVNKK